MMMPEDVARAILLCATLPARTVIEEIIMSPTIQRDTSQRPTSRKAARHAGGARWRLHGDDAERAAGAGKRHRLSTIC